MELMTMAAACHPRGRVFACPNSRRSSVFIRVHLWFLGVAVLAVCGAARAELKMQHEGPLAWICAGVGADERRELEALRPEARLEVEFVTDRRGGYVAGVDLDVQRNGELLLHTTADGPLCLIDGPPGEYRIEATRDGVRRTARATIAKAGGVRRVVLAFPEESWDGIRASPEEKAQAAQP
jgi:hypothetical protein